MPARVDIKISDNADWSKLFAFADEDGVAIDLTGSTFEMDIRAAAQDLLPTATLTTADGSLDLSATPTDGTLTVTIEAGLVPAGAAGASAHYVHDLRRTVGGETEILWRGSLTVIKGVTRDD